MGSATEAIVNIYSLNTRDLKIVNLDDYGVFAWIAEIASHRKIVSDLGEEFLPFLLLSIRSILQMLMF